MSKEIKYRLPEILGIGPGRTGTTWLHRVLEGHVNLPYGVKETQFFRTFYDKGLEWYARHFRYATEDRKVVEICPYLLNPPAVERIKLHIPNCRAIATLRNPVDHTYSVYKMVCHYGWSHGTLDEVLKSRPDLGGANRYAFHLKEWFDTFGRENVLVTFYDELLADPQRYLNQVTDFMEIERIALSERSEIGDNVNSFERAPKNYKLARRATRLRYWLWRRQAYGAINLLERAGVWDFCYGRGDPFGRLTPEQKESLRERYLPEVEELEELLGVDLSGWKEPTARRATVA
ncbi:MAG: sulfotransferase family protein [Candidatus Binatus sp.]